MHVNWYNHVPYMIFVTVSKDKKSVVWTRSHVKGQRRIKILNVRDTSPHGHKLMCQKMILECQNKQKRLVGHEDMSQSLLISPWGQRSMSYRKNECIRHTVSGWYTRVPNMVCKCQAKVSYRPDTYLRTDGRTTRLYPPYLRSQGGGGLLLFQRQLQYFSAKIVSEKKPNLILSYIVN